jgi:hypothetical protein
MQDKNTSVKVGTFLIVLAIGVPIYMFLGGTIEKKRANAIKNAKEPWASDELLACIWRYEYSTRGETAHPLIAEWLKIFGGNDVAELCFPDRFEEIQDYGDDTDHKFKPPRVNKETPHPKTIDMLINHAWVLECTRKSREAEAIIDMAMDDSIFPSVSKEKAAELLKIKNRLISRVY